MKNFIIRLVVLCIVNYTYTVFGQGNYFLNAELINKDAKISINKNIIYKISSSTDVTLRIITDAYVITFYDNDTTTIIYNIQKREICDTAQNYYNFKHQYQYQLKANNSIYIHLEHPDGELPKSLDINFLTYYKSNGDSFENASFIYQGENIILSEVSKAKWCKYYFEEDGAITLQSTSDFIFAYSGKPTYSSHSWNDPQNFLDPKLISVASKTYYSPNTRATLTVSGKKGETLYFKINDDELTPDLWKINLIFKKNFSTKGYDRRQNISLPTGTNTFYLYNNFDNNSFSYFSITNTTNVKKKYSIRLANNKAIWFIIDSLHMWQNIFPATPFIVEINPKSSYIFLLGIQTNYYQLTQQDNQVTLIVNETITGQVTTYKDNITNLVLNTQISTNYQNNFYKTFYFKSPSEGTLKITFKDENLNQMQRTRFYKDPNRIIETSINYQNKIYNSIFLRPNEEIYLAFEDEMPDTFTWKANFFSATDFISLTGNYYYNFQHIPTTITINNDTIFVTLPYNYNIDNYSNIVFLKYFLPLGSYYSQDTFRSNYGNITIDNPYFNEFTIQTNSTSKTYTVVFKNLPSLRTENNIEEFRLTNVMGNVTINYSDTIITINTRKLDYYYAYIRLSPGATLDEYASNYLYYNSTNNLIFFDSTLTYITVVAENNTSKRFIVKVNAETHGTECNDPIKLQTNENVGLWTNNTYFEYIPKTNSAILFTLDLVNNYHGLSVYLYKNCVGAEYLYLNPNQLYFWVKGYKDSAITFSIHLYNDYVNKIKIQEVPYLDENDINNIMAFDVDNYNIFVETFIDKKSKKILVAQKPGKNVDLYFEISEGAQLYYQSEPVNYNQLYNISLPCKVIIKSMKGNTSEWDIDYQPFVAGNEILSFMLPGQLGPGIISSNTNTIICYVPDNTPNLLKFIPSFELSTGACLQYNGVNYISGSTIDSIQFINGTATKTYCIKAWNDNNCRNWQIIVKKAIGPELLSFNVFGQTNMPIIDPVNKIVTANILPYIDIKKVPTYITSIGDAKINNIAVAHGTPINYTNDATLELTYLSEINYYTIKIHQLSKPCSISFDVNISSDTAVFTASSNNDNLIYHWDFGNNNTSNIPYKVKHIYKPGIYSVTLTIYDPFTDCIDSYTRKIEIGTSPCKAEFTFNVNETNRQVTLTNLSKGDIYYWSFGDGTYSSQMNPVKTYANVGTYTISLLVTNSSKTCSDIAKSTVFISKKCDASFSYLIDSTSKTIKLMANYDNYNMLHQWKISDGRIFTGNNIQIHLPANAIYTFHHVVSDTLAKCYDQASITLPIGFENIDCEADFEFYTLDSTIHFINRSMGNIKNYLWNFGDGTLSTNKNPTHLYNKVGLFNVCLSVSNNFVSDITCKRIPSRPLSTSLYKADFTYLITPESKKVAFYSQSTGNIKRYYWDFDDGSHAIGRDVTHNYNVNNYYFIEHRITTFNEQSDFLFKLINVGMPHVIQARFVFFKYEYPSKAGGYPVDFIGAGLGDEARIKWDFGDGTIDTTTTNPTHIYNQPGTYHVCLTVSDPITNEEATYCQNVVIEFTKINKTTSNNLCDIYPMPFDNYINLHLTVKLQGQLKVKLMDITGRFVTELLSQQIQSGSHKFYIPISNLKSGVYYIHLITPDGTIHKQVIKK